MPSLPAPIVPTKYSLMQKARDHTKAAGLSLAIPVPHVSFDRAKTAATAVGSTQALRQPSTTYERQPSPQDFVTLGKLSQGETQWTIRVHKDSVSGLTMVRRLDKWGGMNEKEILGQLAHRNIIKIKRAFMADGFMCIGLEYCRYTLEEVILVHLALEEP